MGLAGHVSPACGDVGPALESGAERPQEDADSDLVGVVDVEESLTGPDADTLLSDSDQRGGGKALVLSEQVVPIENGCQQPTAKLASLRGIVVEVGDT